MFTKKETDLAVKTVEAIKQIAIKKGKKWEWEPEAGEWCIWKGKLELIVAVNRYYNSSEYHYPLIFRIRFSCGELIESYKCIPILRWERLKKIMEKMGYEVRFEGYHHFDTYPCEIISRSFGRLCNVEDKTWQLSVMKAIIKLAEEK